jgi:multiple sugar transport system substrate-binding protein
MTGINKDARLLVGASILGIAALSSQLPWLHKPALRIAIHQGVEGVPLKSIAERFARGRYRGLVEVVELPYDDLFAAELKAVTAVKGGADTGFDVIQLDDPWLPALVAGLRPLDTRKLTRPLDAHDAPPETDDFPGSLWNVCTSPPGKVAYAVPFTGNSQLLCQRGPAKDRPRSWQDLAAPPEQAGERLPFSMRLAPGNSVVTDFLPILWHYDRNAFAETGYDVLGKSTEPAFQLFRKLALRQNWAGAVTQDVDVAASVALNTASSGIVWSAWAMALERLPPDAVGDTLNFTWIPGEQPELGAWLLAIPQNSEHPAQAEEFIQFAVSKKELKEAVNNGNPPPRISVLGDEALRRRFRSFPMQQLSLENARPRTRTPCWRQLESDLGEHLGRYLTASAETEATVLKDLNDAILRIKQRDPPLPGKTCSGE